MSRYHLWKLQMTSFITSTYDGAVISLLAYEKQTGLGRIFGTMFDLEIIEAKLLPVARSHLALLLSWS